MAFLNFNKFYKNQIFSQPEKIIDNIIIIFVQDNLFEAVTTDISYNGLIVTLLILVW
jgi:hypothetical protein